MFALSHSGRSRRRLGRSESPLSDRPSATIAANERGFQPRIEPASTPFRGGRKKASRCAAKNHIQPKRQGRNALGLDALSPSRADVHFGWKRRRIGPLMRGFVPAASE
jgi:hypothetical protein